tara:strand:- start:30 stop:296 length:267 start_codon:yes stop_codon:yes gene_type:complete
VPTLGLAALLATILGLAAELCQFLPLVNALPPVSDGSDGAAREPLDDFGPAGPKCGQHLDDEAILLWIPRTHVLMTPSWHGGTPDDVD